jgi:hypothetical protein
MDPEFKRKLQRAADAVYEVAQQDGCTSVEELAERLAHYFLHHRDPEIREFQRRADEYAARHESELREAEQRRQNQTRRDLN